MFIIKKTPRLTVREFLLAYGLMPRDRMPWAV